MTFEAWVKPAVGVEGTFFHQWGEAYNSSMHSQFWSTPSDCSPAEPCWSLGVAWQMGGATGIGVPDITADAWHHVAISYDTSAGAVSGLISVDGVAMPYSDSSYYGDVAGSTLPVLIGRDDCAAGDCSAYEGLVDEIRIWTYPRSSTEILAALYDPPPPDTPGLAAYWPFDEGSGQWTVEAVTGTPCRFGSTEVEDSDDAAFTTDTPF